jgi:hypothetical protein
MLKRFCGRKDLSSMKNSTVTLLLDQLRQESQKQKEDGDLKDGEYQEITELIGQIERAFTNG